jgi:hydrogenase expression/formation protein HypC
MCLAVPGKIIKIDQGEATVDYDVEKRKGALIEDDYSVGDYVIIQGGIVVQKIEEKEAIQALQLYKNALKE